MKVADLKTLEGFKKFFEPFRDEHFEIKDYSDHESCVFNFELNLEDDLEDGMIFIFEMSAFNGGGSSDYMLFTFSDSEGENYEEYNLTKEQKDHVYEAIEEMLGYILEAKAEAAEYNRDIYAYHGVRRSDFY